MTDDRRFAQAEKSVVVLRSDMRVELVDSMGDDTSVVRAAKVSTAGQGAARYVWHEQAADGLIGYLMRNRHGSPFEHTAFTFYVEAPIFVWREIMRHRIASYNEECLAGSTRVTRVQPSGATTATKNSTLDVLYRNWHIGVPDSLGRSRLLSSCRSIKVRSYNETTLAPTVSNVVDIVVKGEQETWLVTIDSGHAVRATGSHLFFTPEGWKRLSEMSVGDLVYRSGKVREGDESPIPRRLRQGIQEWTTRQKPNICSGMIRCYVCQSGLTYDEAQVDHVIPIVLDISRALDVENLSAICKPCHRKKTSGEQIHARRGVTGSLRSARIVSIGEPATENTYDLVLDGNHNFLASESACTKEGGFVVHNSGRYRKLEPVFYVPAASRPVRQGGTSAHPRLTAGTEAQHELVDRELIRASTAAYSAYERLLAGDVAREVARMVLPVNIYSSAYVTMNARALMNFLSLRVEDEGAAYPSHPMREIEAVARQFEAIFAERMPVTHALFAGNGRVAP